MNDKREIVRETMIRENRGNIVSRNLQKRDRIVVVGTFRVTYLVVSKATGPPIEKADRSCREISVSRTAYV